jgi:hypothetical protein
MLYPLYFSVRVLYQNTNLFLNDSLTNIYLDKLDRQLDALCRQYSTGVHRKQNGRYFGLLGKRKKLLIQGEADPASREALKAQIGDINRSILQTPQADYKDPSYIRVKFLRYADDVVVGVIGPKALAEQIRDEMATFLDVDLSLELNRDKTRIVHLASDHAYFLGYKFKTASPRFRRRNLRRKGSPHNVVQTIKTTSGNITLLVPLRRFSEKLKKYMAKGRPAAVMAFTNQPIDHIIYHYNGVIRGWYNYYQLAENVSSLHYARYILQYSLAKTLAAKERSSVGKIFRKYGKDLTYEKPNGRKVHFFNQPMKQVKKAKRSAADIDALPTWWPRKTQSRLLDNCAICGSQEKVEMHHVRHIRKRGKKVQGFTLYMAAINRKQVPVCQECHREIHNGKYDGPSLPIVLGRLQARNSEI